MEIGDLGDEDWALIVSYLKVESLKVLDISSFCEIRDFYIGTKITVFSNGSRLAHVHCMIKESLAVIFTDIPLFIGNGAVSDAVLAYRLSRGV